MHICVVGLRGIPHVLGGVETHCEQLFPLIKQLRSNDAITVVARKAYVPELDCVYRGLHVVALAHARSKYLETITNAIYGVLYTKLVLQADVLHLHGIGPALTAPLARSLGLKVVVTYHSKNYEHRKWNTFCQWILRGGELCTMVFAHKVIAVSPSLTTDLKARFPRFANKVCFIPNGANHFDESVAAALSADGVLLKFGLKPHGYILSVGRLVPEKGFDDLIKAFNATGLACKLVIAGDANRQDSYAASLLRQASDRVIFTGLLGGPELHKLLQNTSLFVLPSHNEGLSIAALEAAAVGVPLLLSDITANLDLALRPENYFRVGDVEDLRCRLVCDHSVFRAECDRLLQLYNWTTACTQTSNVYSSLQETTGPGHRSRLRAYAKRLIGAAWHRPMAHS